MVKKVEQNELNKHPRRRKFIFVNVIIILFIIAAASLLIVPPQKQKPDPASEKIIISLAAAQLNIDPNIISDEDLAQITKLNLGFISLRDITTLEKFTNLKTLDMSNISL